MCFFAEHIINSVSALTRRVLSLFVPLPMNLLSIFVPLAMSLLSLYVTLTRSLLSLHVTLTRSLLSLYALLYFLETLQVLAPCHGVCCIVFDIDGMLFEFFMIFLTK